MKQKLIFLVGPTAVGKSKVAVILARKLNAEIISCDSMQIYRGMRLLTAQPSLALRKKARHHLIDVVSPTREYNVFQYRKDALKKIKELIKKGKTPLFVGGSGLYMTILIDGIFTAGAQDKKLRQRLYKEAGQHGSECLYQHLKNIDPQAALKIHPHDTRRIIRALEVFETTGKIISELQKQRKGLADKYDVCIFCLNLPREKLYKRIEERIDEMFKQGLLKEVKKLLKLKLSRTAGYAIGVRELKGFFGGLYDLEEARHLMQRNSCLYAKRQLTWFRKDKRIHWVNLEGEENPREIAYRILGTPFQLKQRVSPSGGNLPIDSKDLP